MFTTLRLRLARLTGWPRRLLAVALLIAAAVAFAHPDHGSARAAGPPTTATAAELVAARSLSAGATVTAADVRVVRVPTELRPQGVLAGPAAALGRSLAAPLRRGEPITDLRLIGPRLAESLAGHDAVAAPVRLADADTAALVHPGDHVDVLAAGGHTGRLVAADATVLAVPARRDADVTDGALVVLAVPAAGARMIAGAATSGPITINLRADR